MTERSFYVYILTNEHRTVLHTGMTNDLSRRLTEHGSKASKESFWARYRTDRLVYVEVHTTAYNAIVREKQIKAGSRQKKLDLIAEQNPAWCDLTEDLRGF